MRYTPLTHPTGSAIALIESLESDIDENIQKIWNTEAKKRRDEIRNHTVKPISGEIALAQIRQILEK